MAKKKRARATSSEPPKAPTTRARAGSRASSVASNEVERTTRRSTRHTRATSQETSPLRSGLPSPTRQRRQQKRKRKPTKSAPTQPTIPEHSDVEAENTEAGPQNVDHGNEQLLAQDQAQYDEDETVGLTRSAPIESDEQEQTLTEAQAQYVEYDNLVLHRLEHVEDDDPERVESEDRDYVRDESLPREEHLEQDQADDGEEEYKYNLSRLLDVDEEPTDIDEQDYRDSVETAFFHEHPTTRPHRDAQRYLMAQGVQGSHANGVEPVLQSFTTTHHYETAQSFDTSPGRDNPLFQPPPVVPTLDLDTLQGFAVADNETSQADEEVDAVATDSQISLVEGEVEERDDEESDVQPAIEGTQYQDVISIISNDGEDLQERRAERVLEQQLPGHVTSPQLDPPIQMTPHSLSAKSTVMGTVTSEEQQQQHARQSQQQQSAIQPPTPSFGKVSLSLQQHSANHQTSPLPPKEQPPPKQLTAQPPSSLSTADEHLAYCRHPVEEHVIVSSQVGSVVSDLRRQVYSLKGQCLLLNSQNLRLETQLRNLTGRAGSMPSTELAPPSFPDPSRTATYVSDDHLPNPSPRKNPRRRRGPESFVPPNVLFCPSLTDEERLLDPYITDPRDCPIYTLTDDQLPVRMANEREYYEQKIQDARSALLYDERPLLIDDGQPKPSLGSTRLRKFLLGKRDIENVDQDDSQEGDEQSPSKRRRIESTNEQSDSIQQRNWLGRRISKGSNQKRSRTSLLPDTDPIKYTAAEKERYRRHSKEGEIRQPAASNSRESEVEFKADQRDQNRDDASQGPASQGLQTPTHAKGWSFGNVLGSIKRMIWFSAGSQPTTPQTIAAPTARDSGRSPTAEGRRQQSEQASAQVPQTSHPLTPLAQPRFQARLPQSEPPARRRTAATTRRNVRKPKPTTQAEPAREPQWLTKRKEEQQQEELKAFKDQPPGQKRKRVALPHGPKGQSGVFTFSEEFFEYSDDSDEESTEAAALRQESGRSAKRQRTEQFTECTTPITPSNGMASGDYVQHTILGDPRHASPYTGTLFATPEDLNSRRAKGNVFEQSTVQAQDWQNTPNPKKTVRFNVGMGEDTSNSGSKSKGAEFSPNADENAVTRSPRPSSSVSSIDEPPGSPKRPSNPV